MKKPPEPCLAYVLLRVGFVAVGIAFAFPLVFALLLGAAVGAASSVMNLFFAEWVLFVCLSFILAMKPLLFRSWRLNVAVVCCYALFATWNFMAIFEGGKCFDQYGNVYPYAGLAPDGSAFCIPLL